MNDEQKKEWAKRLAGEAERFGIPDYMIDGIVHYYTEGIPPGDFLSAVINNDLSGATARADMTNRHRLFEYMAFFYNAAPSGTWGYPGAVDAYLKKFHGEDAA